MIYVVVQVILKKLLLVILPTLYYISLKKFMIYYYTYYIKYLTSVYFKYFIIMIPFITNHTKILYAHIISLSLCVLFYFTVPSYLLHFPFYLSFVFSKHLYIVLNQLLLFYVYFVHHEALP